MRIVLTSLVFLFFGFISLSDAYTIIATEKYNGTYENGKFENGKGQFKVRFEVNEKERVIIRTEVIRLKDNNLVEDNTRYSITTIDENAFLVSKDKKGQKIITAVGVPGLSATEMIQIGDDFYYYCKAIGGVLYISYGTIIKEKGKE